MAGSAEHVLVVCGDDQHIEVLVRILTRSGYAVSGPVTGEQALTAICGPLAVVIDVAIADVHAFELCCALRDRYGDDLPIIMVSLDADRADDRVAALLLGADDYLPAPLNEGELLARLRRSLRRRSSVIDNPLETATALTTRELQVLSLLASGANSAAIARKLVISDKTVASHLQRIIAKLGVHSRAQAVAEAYRLGLVQPETAPRAVATGQ